jgi:phage host-nuclease inhibitor protein Gam
MSIKKSSIQQAILEAREIEKIATEKARKAIEEEMAPKIKQVANEALREFEAQTLNEGMNLEIPDGAELTIKMPEDGVENNSADSEIDSTEETEMTGEEPEETTNNEENMSDIFEIEGLFEADDAVQPEMGAPAPTDAAPADATAIPADTAPAEEPASLEVVNQKLDDVLAKLEAISAEEATEDLDGEGEGEVSIIDNDEEMEVPAQPAAETPVQESDEDFEFELETGDGDDDFFGKEEEVVYEVEDDMEEGIMEYELEEEEEEEFDENAMMEMFNEIEGLNELELVDEDEAEFDAEEDSTVDEMLGVGQNFRHSDRLAKLPKQGVEYRSEINESVNKIKAQYGSKIDEQKKEIERLGQTIKEYKDSFIVLRKQINEVQIFNAKLAYANKLFTNGGLTNDEKMKIAEEFDSVETIEEAKKLYNNFLNEMKISKSPKTSVEKLKSVAPSVIKSSNAQTLYESDEMRRMKRLAGIGKNSEE